MFAPHEAADCFAHGNGEPVETDHGATHLEPGPLLGGVEGMFREDAVADLVVVVVERLDGIEVAVDDDVEQAVRKKLTPWAASSDERSQRWSMGPIEKPSFSRTVMSQRSETNASISVSSRLPFSTSTRTAREDRKRCVA